jgi:hypothetical protein
MARFLLLITLAVLCTINPSAAAEPRVALVVGAATYQHAARLAHSLDDARDMAAALKRLGFDVDLVLDPDRARLEAAVRRLGQKARGADAALFFYSGHALESQGVNWVLPVSADVREDRDLRFEALDLSAVLGQIEGSARVSLIFLDACRDDPFKQRLGTSRGANNRGLARADATLSGTYVAFATAPGVVAADGDGRHSPFTGSLLKYIETPALELRQLMSKVRRDVEEATNERQVPWDSSSLKSDFYFNPGNAGKVPDNPQADLDAIFWESVDKKKPADLNAYLARFPQGTFAELARNRLAELNAAAVGGTAPQNPKLLEALAAVLPSFSQKYREDNAAAYQELKGHKAFAVSPAMHTWLRASLRPTAHEAEESALEACQVGAGAPCVLIALDDEVRFASDSAPRAMPRAEYAGRFDPERIPSVQQVVRQRPDVAGYLAAPGPKAAAYNNSGKLFVVTASASQHDAEETALSACGDDATRNGGNCFLYASNNEVVLPRRSKTAITAASQQETPKPPGPAPTANPKLLEALGVVAGAASAKYREDGANGYQGASQHKALAVYLSTGTIWWSPGRPNAQAAEESVLETCEVFAGTPCALVATDDEIKAASAVSPRAMPRVHYEGPFNPERIPSVPQSVRQRADVVSYLAKPGPKAAAYNPVDRLFIVTGAADQHAAEEQALASCNDDKTRNGKGGPCYLYAAGNQVVLPRRSKTPITTVGAVGSPDNSKPPALVTFHDAIAALIEKSTPALAAADRNSLAKMFEDGGDHKALAVHQKDGGNYRLFRWPSADTVEEATLEGCQAFYGEPCALLAVDNEIRLGSDGAPVLRDMPRIRYAGIFSGEQIPAVALGNRVRSDVRGYVAAQGFKAAAFHPWGEIYTVTGAKTQNEAETNALASCNTAPARAGKGGPCYLYASGEQVVFPKRLRLAMTPAAAPAPGPAPAPAPVVPQPAKLDPKDLQLRPLGNALAVVLAQASVPNSAHRAGEFDSMKGHKSIILVPERQTTWIFGQFATAEAVEQIGLEACGLKYNTVCIALAVDDNLKVNTPSNAQRRMMPRLAYQGSYRPETVPMFASPPKIAMDYLNMPAPKAMAIGPNRLKIAAETGATLVEAQAKALAKCSEADSPFPCFIYAVNDKVILPQRRTEPVP